MSDTTASDLQVQRDTHIGRYLIELNRSFVAASLAHLQASGFESVTPHHIHIIAQIDVQGTSFAEVLTRSGVTKQSLSNTLGVLESNGFIQRVISKNDGRSRHIKFTDEGMNLLRAGITAVNEVEAQYADVLGERRFQELKHILGDLHNAVVNK
ncbi:MAG: MarR family transcriptional regulator [Cyanobacteria bacterium J06632_3]